MIPTDIRAAFLRGGWKRFIASGVDIPPFAVMRVVSVNNEDGEIVYTCAQPDTTFRRFYMVNGPFYVTSGSEGLCTTLADAGYVQYNSANTPAVGEVWGPKPSQWSLEKYYYGFEIQGGTKSTAGVSAVVASQHRVTTVNGKTDASHAKSATGTVSLYDSNGTDTTINIPSVLNRFAAVATTKWVHVTWIGDNPQLSAAEC